jgi:membrane protein YqaA with SNARE-associated domain
MEQRLRVKPLHVLLFVAALIISIGILFIPTDSAAFVSLGYLGVFLVTLIGAASLFIPGPTMIIAFNAGAILNPAIVSVVAGLGSAIGETTGYLIGYGGQALAGNRWQIHIEKAMKRYAFLTVFALSAIPNPLTDVGGLVAGWIRYPFPKYFLATFLGKVVRFGMAAMLGVWILRRSPF